jgi:GntR family transcriptional regulator
MPRPEPVVAVDAGSSIPPSVQIFEQIRAAIERGELSCGDALPPVRQLAGDLSVAPNTVVRASADLRAEGWVTSEERRPTRVAPRTPARARASRRSALQAAVTAFLTSLATRGYSAEEIAAETRSQLTTLSP